MTVSTGSGSGALGAFFLTSTSGASAAHLALASSSSAFQPSPRAFWTSACFSLPLASAWSRSTADLASARVSLS